MYLESPIAGHLSLMTLAFMINLELVVPYLLFPPLYVGLPPPIPPRVELIEGGLDFPGQVLSPELLPAEKLQSL